MSLPLFQKSNDQNFVLMQTQWKGQLDPILAIPMLSGIQLRSVSLTSGTTVINHLLGRMQQGWIITDQNGAASIYRTSSLNDKTLTLFSDAQVTVNLWVY